MYNFSEEKRIKKEYNLRYRPAIYTTFVAAQRGQERSEKPRRIIMGENNRFWLVCPADAAKCQKAGLEYAK